MTDEQHGPSCSLHDPEPTSLAAATAARLTISADCEPGIRRFGQPGSFRYVHQDGGPVSAEDKARAEALKIPPAWTDVWICGSEDGHLQATGRDARGRKQYRYHDRWREIRDETKYERMVAFGEALPDIRERVDRDLRRPALDRPRVLALVVAVLDATLVRVGNAEYARDNESFGLTTLRAEHAEVGGATVRLRFRGKAGKELRVGIDNPRIARALRRTRDLPGQELFQYLDEAGEPRVIGSGDVNDYLRETTGLAVTSKDFRTWGGSLAFWLALHADPGQPSVSSVTAAVREAATVLGNTPAVCRKSYIHPGLINLYLAGGMADARRRAEESEPPNRYVRDEERIFLGVVRELSAAAASAA